MIPKYLDGKSAVEIVDEIRDNFNNIETGDLKTLREDYIRNLEYWLVLAVKDALMNCEEVKELIQDGEYQAQQRAIAFLNTVLPKE